MDVPNIRSLNQDGAGLLQETRRRQQLLRDEILATRLRQQSFEADGPLQATRRRQQILRDEIESARLRRMSDDEAVFFQETYRRQQFFRAELDKTRLRQQSVRAALIVASLSSHAQAVQDSEEHAERTAVAFCMGTHSRLGDRSLISLLPDLVMDRVVRLLLNDCAEEKMKNVVAMHIDIHQLIGLSNETDRGMRKGYPVLISGLDQDVFSRSMRSLVAAGDAVLQPRPTSVRRCEQQSIRMSLLLV